MEQDRSVSIALPVSVQMALERLRQHGFLAYAVGGCVRDSLLGKSPQDWDITTSALPEETLRVFADLPTYEIGIRHGTVTVFVEGDPLEITTFRVDGAYTDNRRPDSVSFTRTLREDLLRRDFTVNALAYAPGEGVWDFFHGREDLRQGLLRCVGDADTRFREDALRILRGLRFASVLGFSLEKETADAIHRNRSLLQQIAVERIRVEWDKLLRGKAVVPILAGFSDVVEIFLPELFSKATAPENWKEMVSDLPSLPAEGNLRFAWLLEKTGCAADCQPLLRRMKYERATIAELTCLLEHLDVPLPATSPEGCRFLQKFGPQQARTILRYQGYRGVEAAEKSLALCEELLRAGACYQIAGLQITGDDLLKLGCPKGKAVGKLLENLLEQVMDGLLPNRREELCDAARETLEKNLK